MLRLALSTSSDVNKKIQAYFGTNKSSILNEGFITPHATPEVDSDEIEEDALHAKESAQNALAYSMDAKGYADLSKAHSDSTKAISDEVLNYYQRIVAIKISDQTTPINTDEIQAYVHQANQAKLASEEYMRTTKELSDRHATYVTTMEGIKDNIFNTKDSITTIESNITDMTNTVKGTVTEINVMKLEIDTDKNTINTSVTAITNVKDEIDNTLKDVNEKMALVNDGIAHVDTVKSEVSTMASNAATSLTTISGHVSKVTSLVSDASSSAQLAKASEDKAKEYMEKTAELLDSSTSTEPSISNVYFMFINTMDRLNRSLRFIGVISYIGGRFNFENLTSKLLNISGDTGITNITYGNDPSLPLIDADGNPSSTSISLSSDGVLLDVDNSLVLRVSDDFKSYQFLIFNPNTSKLIDNDIILATAYEESGNRFVVTHDGRVVNIDNVHHRDTKWQPLKLLNGWEPYSNDDGQPEWRIHDNEIQLRGKIDKGDYSKGKLIAEFTGVQIPKKNKEYRALDKGGHSRVDLLLTKSGIEVVKLYSGWVIIDVTYSIN